MCGFLVQFSQKNDDFNHFEEAIYLLNNRGPDVQDIKKIRKNINLDLKDYPYLI